MSLHCLHRLPCLRTGLLAAACLGLPVLPAATAAPPAATSACGPQPCTAEQLSRCRQANEAMLEQVRQLPATTADDRRRLAALQAKVQALVRDNRKNRVDECSTWNALGGIAASQ